MVGKTDPHKSFDLVIVICGAVSLAAMAVAIHAWPVSGWIATFVVSALLLRLARSAAWECLPSQGRYLPGGDKRRETAKRVVAELVTTIAEALRRLQWTAIASASGVLILCLLIAVAAALPLALPESLIQSGKVRLSALHDHLAGAQADILLIWCLAGGSLAAMALPVVRTARQFAIPRAVLTVVGLAVAAVAMPAFLAVPRLAEHQRVWIRDAGPDLQALASTIGLVQRELVTIALVEETVAGLSEERRADLRAFFDQVGEVEGWRSVVTVVAEDFGDVPPQFAKPPETGAGDLMSGEIGRLHGWDPTGPIVYESFVEVGRFTRDGGDLLSRLSRERDMAIQALELAVAGQFGVSADDKPLEHFLNRLVRSASYSAFAAGFPLTVRDAETAAEWYRRAAPDVTWSWTLRPASQERGGSREAMVAAYIEERRRRIEDRNSALLFDRDKFLEDFLQRMDDRPD